VVMISRAVSGKLVPAWGNSVPSASTVPSATTPCCRRISVALTKWGRLGNTRTTAAARCVDVSFACCVDNSKSPC
jgi:hypothetical protein